MCACVSVWVWVHEPDIQGISPLKILPHYLVTGDAHKEGDALRPLLTLCQTSPATQLRTAEEEDNRKGITFLLPGLLMLTGGASW